MSPEFLQHQRSHPARRSGFEELAWNFQESGTEPPAREPRRIIEMRASRPAELRPAELRQARSNRAGSDPRHRTMSAPSPLAHDNTKGMSDGHHLRTPMGRNAERHQRLRLHLR